METKENKYQIILLGTVIICAIFTFVTIAWAAFSTTLKIKHKHGMCIGQQHQ